MPIYVYGCDNECGQRIETLTQSISKPVPAQIRSKCPRCGSASTFSRVTTAAAIRTPATTQIARRNDYRRAKPNAKENVIAGKTSAGQPVREITAKSKNRTGAVNSDYAVGAGVVRRGNGSVIPQRVLDSQADWNDSYTEAYDRPMDKAREEISEMAKE